MRARARREKGTALLWAMLTIVVVAGGLATIAGGLTRQARTVRHLHASEATADLAHAATVLASYRRAHDPAWAGPETLRLAGGEVEVWVEGGGPVPTHSSPLTVGREEIEMRLQWASRPSHLGVAIRLAGQAEVLHRRIAIGPP